MDVVILSLSLWLTCSMSLPWCRSQFSIGPIALSWNYPHKPVLSYSLSLMPIADHNMRDTDGMPLVSCGVSDLMHIPSLRKTRAQLQNIIDEIDSSYTLKNHQSHGLRLALFEALLQCLSVEAPADHNHPAVVMCGNIPCWSLHNVIQLLYSLQHMTRRAATNLKQPFHSVDLAVWQCLLPQDGIKPCPQPATHQKWISVVSGSYALAHSCPSMPRA